MHIQPPPFTVIGSVQPLVSISNPLTPMVSSTVSAGIPFHGDTHVETHLDLNTHLIAHPAATFFIRVQGESMIGAGIHSGDVLIVDRAIEPANGAIVIASLNGEFTVKRIRKSNHAITLIPENESFKPIVITDAMDFQVWGVVTYVIHKTLP